MKFSLQSKLSVWAAIGLFTLATLPFASVVGCSSSTVVNELNVVLTEATNVISVADPTASWGPELKSAVAALKTAETSWQSGGAVADVTSALNTIVAITAVIPLTAAYSPLIDVLVAGIEAVLVALPANALLTANYATMAAGNPHVGRYHMVHHFMHSSAGDFRKNWNDVAKQSGYATLTIK